VISGLTQPTAVRFASDGRIFVAQKNGLLLEYDSLSDPTPTTVADLRTAVDDYWDRGLLGLALDPNFPNSPYIYVLYTYDAPPGGTAPRWNDACPTPPGPNTDGCVVQGRLSRLTISGNASTNEQILIQGWCQQFPSHSIGDLRFGTDGSLFVSGGDGASFSNADWGQYGGSSGSPTRANPCGDPPSAGTALSPPTAEGGALRSQSPQRAAGEPAVLNGSVLRVDPATGAGVAVNPFASRSDANLRRIVAYGFRNPFRFTLRPGTNDLWVGDVGWNTWEEINRSPDPTVAKDFGWPCYEGTGPQPVYQSDNLNICNSLYASGGSGGTFGTTNPASGFDTLDANTKGVTKFSSPVSGQLTKVEGYLSGLGSTTGSQVLKAVVYADNGGVPGTLLGTSNAVTVNAGAAFSWVPFTFTTPPTVTAGPVWIGYLAGTTSALIQARLDNASGVIKYNANTYSGGATNPFGAASQASKLNGWAIRATYATSGGGSAVTPPLYTYNHSNPVVSGDNCSAANGSSVTGLAFYNGGSYPGAYNGALFFADHTRNCIWVMMTGANGLPDPNQISAFDTPAAGPVDLEIGPGGDLFYVDFDGGTIRRIQYSSANQPPVAVASATPTSGAAPLAVNFDGSGSSDPDGDPITYSWDLNGDGVYGDATSATPSFTYQAAGTYVVHLKVTDSHGASTVSSPITIDAGNTPPAPTISSPSSTLTWKVGDPISFSGGATDAQDGTIPATGLSWLLIIHHCPTPSSCHTHNVQTFAGVSSGSFNAPDHEYPCWLELQLTATDSKGLSATTSVRLDPKTVDLTFASSPSGAQLSAGSTSATAPFTKTVVINSAVAVGALSPQTIGTGTYTFTSWSDGGAQSHTITAPAAASTYTATFTQQTTSTFGATNPGSIVDTLDANTKGVSKYTAPVAGQITKVEGWLSGLGAASGSQVVKAVVYSDSNGVPGSLLGTSNAVTITAGTAFGWVPFTFSAPVTIGAGPVWVGYLAGASTGVTQFKYDTSAGAVKYNADTYVDGASNPFGTAGTASKPNPFSIRVTVG